MTSHYHMIDPRTQAQIAYRTKAEVDRHKAEHGLGLTYRYCFSTTCLEAVAAGWRGKMPVRTFEIPKGTLEAMRALANITNIDEENALAKLLQDALHIYEWVLAHQVQGRTVAALDDATLTTLQQQESASSEWEALVAFVAPEKRYEARAYFNLDK